MAGSETELLPLPGDDTKYLSILLRFYILLRLIKHRDNFTEYRDMYLALREAK
jgi:hypothetical protein